MLNMEELLNQISVEITRVQNEPLRISKTDLEYAYGQLKVSDETRRQCYFAITGGNMKGYYRFKKGFCSLSDIPTKFQEKLNRTLNYQTPVWLKDILVVTKGTKRNTGKKLFTLVAKLQEAGYRASEKNPNPFSRKRSDWATK